MSNGMELSGVVDRYMARAEGLEEHCERCLETERWGGDPVLMVVDAAFTSIGLNYFQSVVPQVMEFEEEMVEKGLVQSFDDLRAVSIDVDEVRSIWANKRSWSVASSVASYLTDFGRRNGLPDREAFRKWAEKSSLKNWEEDPVGEIWGVGINIYQYLRMMGGVDTAMPDKIVRRVVEEILEESGEDFPTEGDIELIRTIEEIASRTGYRPIEVCWMTWLVQSEGDKVRMEKYRDVLHRI